MLALDWNLTYTKRVTRIIIRSIVDFHTIKLWIFLWGQSEHDWPLQMKKCNMLSRSFYPKVYPCSYSNATHFILILVSAPFYWNKSHSCTMYCFIFLEIYACHYESINWLWTDYPTQICCVVCKIYNVWIWYYSSTKRLFNLMSNTMSCVSLNVYTCMCGCMCYM